MSADRRAAPRRRYPMMQIDAFSDLPLAGNPCAVLLDAGDLDDATMLAVAREMNLSETAFVSGSTSEGFAARYFTPAEEIPLAGHPTLATARALLDTGRLAHDGDATSFDLRLRDGPVRVELRGAAPEFFMTQRRPTFGRVYPAAEIMPLFGLAAEDGLAGCDPQTVGTGTPMLMIPVRDHDALRRARLQEPEYAGHRQSGDYFSPHLFTMYGFTEAGATAARHFGVPPDTREDPFTGSATGAMAAYCHRYALLDGDRFVAEQGHAMQRPGQASVELEIAADTLLAVRVGGHAVTVLEGEIRF